MSRHLSDFICISAQGKSNRLCISDAVINPLPWSQPCQVAGKDERKSFSWYLHEEWQVGFLEFSFFVLSRVSGRICNHFGLCYSHQQGSSCSHLPHSREGWIPIWSGAIQNWTLSEIPRASPLNPVLEVRPVTVFLPQLFFSVGANGARVQHALHARAS